MKFSAVSKKLSDPAHQKPDSTKLEINVQEKNTPCRCTFSFKYILLFPYSSVFKLHCVTYGQNLEDIFHTHWIFMLCTVRMVPQCYLLMNMVIL